MNRNALRSLQTLPGILALLALALAPCCAEGQAAQMIATQDVRITAVPPQAPRTRFGPELESFQIEYDVVEVRAGQTLKDLLGERNIAAGGGAYGIIFSANPDLHDANRLREGQTLLMPRIEGAHVPVGVPGDYLWKLDAYAELDAQATSAFSTLQTTVERLRPLIGEEQREGEEPPRLLRAMDEISQAIDLSRMPNSTAGPAALSMVYSYSKLANELLGRIHRRIDPGPEADLNSGQYDPGSTRMGPYLAEPGFHGLRSAMAQVDTLEELAIEMTTIGDCVIQNLSCELYTQIQTFTPAGETVPNLQLFAAPIFAAGADWCRSDPLCTRPFYGLSSPCGVHLAAEGRWIVWAEGDGGESVGESSVVPRHGISNEFVVRVEIDYVF